MLRFTQILSGLLLTALLVFALSGCGTPKPAGLADERIISLTENILQSLDEGDYDKFVQDFSQPMLNAFPPENFTDLRDMLQATSGNFVSVGELGLSNRQGYAVYRIPCNYELETVTVTITFAIEGDKVEGLFFTSPNLIKHNQ